MQWDYPCPFTHLRKVAINDIDGMGHVNNAVYVKWCEDVAWLHSASLGLTIEDYQRLDKGVAIRKGSYEYVAPSLLDDELILATWLTASDGKLRLQRSFQIFDKKSEQLRLRGEWQLICVTLSSGKPSRFPREFIDSYISNIVTTKPED